MLDSHDIWSCLIQAAHDMHVQVSPIVEQVRERGDAAVREFTSRFDRVELDDVCVRIEVCVLRLLPCPGVSSLLVMCMSAA